MSHGLELEPISNVWARRKNENGILFLVVYFMLKEINGELTQEDKDVFCEIVNNLEAWDPDQQIKGLYDRGAHESNPQHEFYVDQDERRKISHDNLTAIASFSCYFDLPYSQHIAQYALKHLFMFDNRYPNRPKLVFKKPDGKYDTSFQFHPRDWFFWLWCGKGRYRLLSYIFFPVFFLANIITCRTEYGETSGKQLMFARLGLLSKKSLLMRFNYWICKKMMEKKYGKNWLEKIFEIYYHQRKDNPIRIQAEGLEV